MGKIYGYARCSTDPEHQDINRQKRELMSLGVVEEKNIYCEYESGVKNDRVELLKLLDIVQEGDSIVTTEVSRLTRSTKHLCDILQIVQDKKLILKIGNSFEVDCSHGEIDPMTDGMIKMWGVFAEMERNIISQRVKSGMANASAKGKQIGRPKLSYETIPAEFFKYFPKYNNGEINISEFSRLMRCSRTTIYKYLNMINE